MIRHRRYVNLLAADADDYAAQVSIRYECGQVYNGITYLERSWLPTISGVICKLSENRREA
ncbi:MAG: hypothetical protein ACXV5T_07370 [Halobacteriota archaeon]